MFISLGKRWRLGCRIYYFKVSFCVVNARHVMGNVEWKLSLNRFGKKSNEVAKRYNDLEKEDEGIFGEEL